VIAGADLDATGLSGIAASATEYVTEMTELGFTSNVQVSVSEGDASYFRSPVVGFDDGVALMVKAATFDI
jgi:hypothetical protein